MAEMIRQCLKSDLKTLEDISIETFQDTFAEMNTEATIQQYLHDAFSPSKLTEEISCTGSRFFFIFHNKDLAGYLKVNNSPDQTDINDPRSLEIERIYIRKSFKEKGLGKELMNFAISLAKKANLDYLWLGVWEKNTSAISFYKKMGFITSGKHKFMLGLEEQSDLVMKKNILT
jgi:ribosomal protein S18 acetylase RimI-like enzyme